MRVGVLLLPTDPWPETVARVRRLEALGYDHLWTYDHLSWRRYRDQAWHAAVPWLTGVAAATERVRIGTLVTSPNFRHPAPLAKEAMTLDHISGGRLVLGIGAGGTGFDATVLGGERLGPGARAARLGEFVEVLDRLLRDGEASHDGPWFRVDGAQVLPGCVQRPRVPFAIAAGSAGTLALTARFADSWVTYGDPEYRDTTAAGVEAAVRAQRALLEAACADIGRDPAGIDSTYLIGNTDERPLAGVGAFVDFAGRAAALGFTDLVFHHPRPGDPVWSEPEEIVERIAVEALPQVRCGAGAGPRPRP
jgi:alkanesulfonate monooxygenase SsuD/methylene tetrahydromethanopterin reductase-like flavin-dependent oxidoreductase (luciferase family)